MMNLIAIHGRLVRDPELRKTANGVSVASFTVAVDRSYTPQGQEKQADFFDCIAWKGQADTISKYFSKGSEVVLNGSMQCRKWQDKEGNNRYSWEVQVREFDFSGSKNDKSQAEPSQKSSQKPIFEDFEGDGDLPF